MSEHWENYFKFWEGKPPKPLLLSALKELEFEAGDLSYDLGAGTGIDTVEMLRQGLRVVAIDSSARAFDYIKEHVPSDLHDALECEVAKFGEFEFRPCKFVYASMSLFFAGQEEMQATWKDIWKNLEPGGIFAGQMMGPGDDWAKNGLSAVTRAELEEMLEGTDVLLLDETNKAGSTAAGSEKHWHLFDIIARKR